MAKWWDHSQDDANRERDRQQVQEHLQEDRRRFREEGAHKRRINTREEAQRSRDWAVQE